MAVLTLLQGPAGSGKSGDALSMLASGEASILADLTALWAALRGVRRDPETGKYPIRGDDDPGLMHANYLRTVAVRHALESGQNVVVTTGTPDQAPKWAAVARAAGASFDVRTVDPGREVAANRLSVNGVLSDQCNAALARWYET